MNAPLAQLFRDLASIRPRIATRDEYLRAGQDRKSAIRADWFAVGHGYRGNGSERRAAFELYCWAVASERGTYSQPMGSEDDYDGDGGRGKRDEMDGY